MHCGYDDMMRDNLKSEALGQKKNHTELKESPIKSMAILRFPENPV